jgi:microcystin-dependent protein
MAQPFIGEIRVMSFNFAPRNWALCNGQLVPINQNQALFSLLGTTYGGNGQTNFALPDLRGRAPVHFGPHLLGATGGQEVHTLVSTEMPIHRHALLASSANGNSVSPTANVLARRLDQPYLPPAAIPQAMHPSSITTVGAGQPHENRQPYLTLVFCIALQGIFPSRN